MSEYFVINTATDDLVETTTSVRRACETLEAEVNHNGAEEDDLIVVSGDTTQIEWVRKATLPDEPTPGGW